MKCLILFAILFAFSCSNTEIPELPQSNDGLQNGSEEGNEVSGTRCKDDQGRNHFCQWTNGSCWAIDPEFSETAGATCESEIQACRQDGYLYINSTIDGTNTRCSGGELGDTRCKDGQGRDYFCQWSTGCYAIDPAYANSERASCTTELSECRQHGTLYVNSETEGASETCNGTRAN